MSKAFATLGLPDTATPDEVKAKWRELCMIHHPDRGGNSVEFNTIRKAYRAAMEEASEPKPCSTCKGSGKVTQTAGWSSIEMPCQTCGGLGHA